MTDREKLEKMLAQLLTSEENTYFRMKKENVLQKLVVATNKVTGKLSEVFIIPIYEHDVDFMKKTLEELGYSPEYKEEYNDFWQTTCYKVTL